MVPRPHDFTALHPMSMHLSLLVPGLTQATPHNPSLSKLVTRGIHRALPVHDLEGLLFHVFDIDTDPARDRPVAPLTRLSDQLDAQLQGGYWLRADPVHLRADRNTVMLFEPQVLDLCADELDTLTNTLNAHYRADGWRFFFPHPRRGYVWLPEDPCIRTYDLAEVNGRSIDERLPSGPRGRQWQSVLNEMQMLLHASPINETRQRRGALPVNGLWLWGGGAQAPRVTKSPSWNAVWADDPTAVGLAHAAALAVYGCPSSAHALLTAGVTALVVLNAAVDDAQWERNWWQPLHHALHTRTLSHLTLYSERGHCLDLKPTDLWRFWRRGGWPTHQPGG